jgi:YD repeat-containing protein
MLSKNGRRRLTTAVMALLLIPGSILLVPQAAAATSRQPFPEPAQAKRVPLTKKKTVNRVNERAPYGRFDATARADLPDAGLATVDLSSKTAINGASAAEARSWQRAGSSPVLLSPGSSKSAPRTVQVETSSQQTARAAGVRGVLFSLRSGGDAGHVEVNVDPTTFRNAYGGDYAARLRLVTLPSCVLRTPERSECQKQTVISSASAPMTAAVTLADGASAATVLAATSDSSGSTGDYGATSLSPGGSWAVEGNTGSFSYTYPIVLPPAIGTLAPTLELSYNSSSQDARTAGTNNQSSWIGDGWKSTESFIERTYRNCPDVSGSGVEKQNGDLCWGGEILTMSLNGTSTAIVYDDKTKTLRPATDDSTVTIEKRTGATNGTKNGEYFVVTQSGVRYYFGLNRLPGWTSGEEETKSAYTVPVYKAHAGISECPDKPDFGDTACVLGYRFNLDYAVDLSGNAMAFYYAPEVGYYGANLKDDAVKYIRGGTLRRIDYGMTSATIYSVPAPEQVVFNVAERCLAGAPAGNTCSENQFTVSHPEYWPDTPIDLNCAADAKDCTNHSPSFWIRTRLTSIVTQVRIGADTKQVSRYALTHTFPDGGDHAPKLWLDRITHTGLDRLGGATAEVPNPPVSFTPVQLANRVGTIPGLPRMYHNRITTVTAEAGAQTSIEYSTPTCAGLPASDPTDIKDTAAQKFASTNTTGCFPAYWTPVGQPEPLIDWFYTYPVKRATTIDPTNAYQDGSQPKTVTEYAYKGNPGWHYDDNEVVKARNRTWGQFRGYPLVEITTGDTSVFHYTDKKPVHDKKTLTKNYYFLGMNGDTLPDGKTREVPALTSQDGTVTVADHNAYGGLLFESESYTEAGGTLHSATVTVPTKIGPTASRDRPKLPALSAEMVRPAKTLTRTKVSYGWRKTEKATFYNTTLGQSTTGMAIQTTDRGEIGATGNVAQCTFSRYLDGAVATVVPLAEIITTDQDCPTAGAAPAGNLISHVRTSFDGNAFARNGDGQANPARPTRGYPTLVQQASNSTGATATAFVDEKAVTYDSYGRTTSITATPRSTAANGVSIAQTFHTRRTPAAGALPTKVVTVTQVTSGADCSSAAVSSKDCHLVTEVRNPARQLPVAVTDAAGGLTSMAYDALGRLTSVWLPNQSKAAGAVPSVTYAYKVSSNSPSVVTTKSLLDSGEYSVKKVLYDAMQRQLETQSTGENGTVIVSDVQYDSHGRTVLTNNAYAVAGEPSDALVSDSVSQATIPATTVHDHDGLGRVTLSTDQHNGAATAQTRTVYTGDTTTVIPPQGGIAVTETTNARTQRTRLDQYTQWPTISGDASTGFTVTGGISQSIKYAYTAAGKLSTVTGPDNAVWSYKFDLRGRQTSQSDPDTGTGTAGYDDAGNLLTARDARGVQLDYTYDLLGRKLSVTDRLKNLKLASWTYDTLKIGLPTASTRYVSGVTGGYTVAVTDYTTLGRPLGQTISLPGAETALPTDYTTKFRYSLTEERLLQQESPAVGGLPGEVITYGYSKLGAPTRTSGVDPYVTDSVYTDFGKPSKITMGASTSQVEAIYEYEQETLRLKSRTVSRSQGIGPIVDKTSYAYDQAGNPLSVTSEQRETGNAFVDRQCYRYNPLKRLTDAWTAPADCNSSSTPTVTASAGSYWQTFAYDLTGNRTEVVDHATTSGTDITTRYTNGCSTGCNRTGAQPHTLTETRDGPDPTKFAYDVTGRLLTRTATSGNNQKLTWDTEGRLAEVVTAGANAGSTKYVYDADGNQLIRRDPGKTTLFAGDTQIIVNTAVSPNVIQGAVRVYKHGGNGEVIAVRSTLPGGGTHYLFNDPHGTAGLAIDSATHTLSRQEYKPYGETRGSPNSASWPDSTRGYLGAPKNAATGYTDLGARKYDPLLVRQPPFVR